MSQNRGQLTPQIQELAKKHFNREITVAELRLMPYIDYLLKNEQKIKPEQVNGAERDVLRIWKDAGYMDGGMTGIAVTREFFNILQEFLWVAYVAHDASKMVEVPE